MPKTIPTIPIQTPPMGDDSRFSTPWEKWLRDLGQNSSEACRVVTDTHGLSWTAFGAMLAVCWSGAGGVTVTLPVRPAVPGVLVGRMDGVVAAVPVTGNTFAVPAGVAGQLAGVLLVDISVVGGGGV